MKLVFVITNKTYINKNKKEVPSTYYALEFENGRRIPIKPVYDDYDILEFQREKVIDLRKVNKNDDN